MISWSRIVAVLSVLLRESDCSPISTMASDPSSAMPNTATEIIISIIENPASRERDRGSFCIEMLSALICSHVTADSTRLRRRSRPVLAHWVSPLPLPTAYFPACCCSRENKQSPDPVFPDRYFQPPCTGGRAR